MTPEERRAKAIHYRSAMEDGIVNEMLAAVEHQLMTEWKVAGSLDERENLHRTVRIIGLLRSHMASIAAGERDGGISAIKRVK